MRRGSGASTRYASWRRASRSCAASCPATPSSATRCRRWAPSRTQAVARRAYQLADGRLSLLGQMGLAVLQVADWVQDGGQPAAARGGDRVHRPGRLLRLGGRRGRRGRARSCCARWAGSWTRPSSRATAGSSSASATARWSCSRAPDEAVAGTREALDAVAAIRCDGYKPQLRAGVHFGEPTRIGGDYLGRRRDRGRAPVRGRGRRRDPDLERGRRADRRGDRARLAARAGAGEGHAREPARVPASAPRLFAWPTARPA